MGQLNVENCMELRRLSMSTLKNEFGAKIGERLYNFARGVDNRTLPEASNVDSALENADRKSVSCDVNYGIRFSQIEEIENFLKQLAGEVSKRLQTSSSKGKTITLKCLVIYWRCRREAPEKCQILTF
uniref:DNA polymerase Y-family little finger domain-containing protein n=1 Tax=Romanomermis culicivorax TaxID=13658 RepID=A0A915KFQ6_ROMCU